jgi:serine/threonine protein phosphatase PrpC
VVAILWLLARAGASARANCTQAAEKIARAAQAFGQQDDITVLTVSLARVEAVHA